MRGIETPALYESTGRKDEERYLWDSWEKGLNDAESTKGNSHQPKGEEAPEKPVPSGNGRAIIASSKRESTGFQPKRIIFGPSSTERDFNWF